MNNRNLAAFLLSEKDTRPHWETDRRHPIAPAMMSGYNNSVASRWNDPSTWAVPGLLGGHSWSTMDDIVKGNRVSPDEIKHSANEAAGAALVGSLPMGATRSGASLGSGGGSTTGVRAYHGSPHDFDRFDVSKMGTGEGAQAYGRGLYFAENENVAKFYKQDGMGNSLINSNIHRLTQERADAASALREALSKWRAPGFLSRVRPGDDIISSMMSTGHDMINDAQSVRRLAAISDEAPVGRHARALSAIDDKLNMLIDENKKIGAEKGKMYEVDIRAQSDDFLDWDKPLDQQSKKVADTLGRHIGPGDDLSKNLGSPGSQIYEKIRAGGGETEADLKEGGIAGIRYLDAVSRSVGDGSRNYVVFDDKLIEILRKYGLAGVLAGGYAMTGQEPQE